MAKPTKYAPLTCIIVNIIAVIGIVLGLLFMNPLVTTVFLLPAVIYEVYRTEGASTKTSSIIMLVVLILEIVLLVSGMDFDLAELLDAEKKYIAGYYMPLGRLSVVAPMIMSALSVVLFVRTRGVYTRWLAAIIFVTSFVIIYTMDLGMFQEMIKFGVEEGLRKVSY